MKDKEIRILSTRPLDGALIEKAAFQNIIIDTVSFIDIRKQLSNEAAERINLLAKQKAIVVFTSISSVEIVVEAVPVNPLMPDWKIYCMGGATFTLIKKYWPYNSVVFTAKNSTELANRIVEDKVESIAFFCGNQRREELPELLQQQNIAVEELAVYQTIETPSAIKKEYSGILFFSPSAVQSFFSHNEPSADTVLFSIGHTTANAIKQFSSNRIIVSDFPAKDQLIDKAMKYFDERKSKT